MVLKVLITLLELIRMFF
ncbi:TPA: damage-inducible type I toxin DinQ [Salmonella enterica subsp. enterica serovar Muenchen]